MSNQILDLIEKSGFVSAHDLAISANISIFLARQRLIDCESAGIICRDESIEGLLFYPNKFV
jgi:ESCRT-II complex subunit VPS36